MILNAPLPPKNLLRGFGEPNIGIKKYMCTFTHIFHMDLHRKDKKGLKDIQKGLEIYTIEYNPLRYSI